MIPFTPSKELQRDLLTGCSQHVEDGRLSFNTLYFQQKNGRLEVVVLDGATPLATLGPMPCNLCLGDGFTFRLDRGAMTISLDSD